MKQAVLKLVTPDSHHHAEQLTLRPVIVFVREGMPVPFRVRLLCRRPPRRAVPVAPKPAPRAPLDLLAYRPPVRPKRRPPKPVRRAALRVFAPRKLRPGARPRSMGLRPISEVERRQLLVDEAALRKVGLLQRPAGEHDADCEDADLDTPCPFVGCRLNLYAEVDDLTGALKINFPDKEVWELEETCALRVVKKRGALSLEEVGKLINLTQERVSTIEEGGMRKMKRRVKGGGRA